jgi:hypothetical protein
MGREEGQKKFPVPRGSGAYVLLARSWFSQVRESACKLLGQELAHSNEKKPTKFNVNQSARPHMVAHHC